MNIYFIFIFFSFHGYQVIMKAKATQVFCHAKHHQQLSKEIADKEGAEGMCLLILYTFAGKKVLRFEFLFFC